LAPLSVLVYGDVAMGLLIGLAIDSTVGPVLSRRLKDNA